MDKDTISFADLKLNKNLLKVVDILGFKHPSEIQEKVIPHILAGKDVIAQAKTGSGKTAAFALPSLELIKGRKDIGLLVITPTRELAQQVCEEINRYGKYSQFEALAVYGGQSITVQLKKLRQGVQAIVATPGRLLDLLKSNKLKGLNPSLVVLDEADEMLDMGFLEDIQEIFSCLNEDRQTLLFSATMPKPIQNLANKVLKSPLTINVTQGQIAHNDIKQVYYLTKERDKDLALVRIFDHLTPFKSIVFCRTKKDVDRLYNTLLSLKYNVRALHGDMAQRERQQSIAAFLDGSSKILVATDVAGRGLNVPDTSHVFNYHIPYSAEAYTHRIGRTGRAGRKGTAISLLAPSEFRQICRMFKLNKDKMDIQSVPTLSELKEKQHEDLLEKIRTQDIHEASESAMNTLQSSMNLFQIGQSLLSILLNGKEFSGPEKLGMNLEEIHKNDHKKSRNRFTRGASGGRKESRSQSYSKRSSDRRSYKKSSHSSERPEKGFFTKRKPKMASAAKPYSANKKKTSKKISH